MAAGTIPAAILSSEELGTRPLIPFLPFHSDNGIVGDAVHPRDELIGVASNGNDHYLHWLFGHLDWHSFPLPRSGIRASLCAYVRPCTITPPYRQPTFTGFPRHLLAVILWSEVESEGNGKVTILFFFVNGFLGLEDTPLGVFVVLVDWFVSPCEESHCAIPTFLLEIRLRSLAGISAEFPFVLACHHNHGY